MKPLANHESKGMELLLWRHAEAEDGTPDHQRALTHRGIKQAQHVAQWLHKHLPDHARILCSPAVRTRQTVEALGRKYETRSELSVDGNVESVLHAAG